MTYYNKEETGEAGIIDSDPWLAEKERIATEGVSLCYNLEIENRYYVNQARYCECFWKFALDLSQLDKYYEYSKVYFKQYLEKEEKLMEETLESTDSYYDEEKQIYEEMLENDVNSLELINYETILLMMYTLFENFLKTLINDVCLTYSIKYIEPTGKYPIINKYLFFLNNTCDLNIYLPYKAKKTLSIMRRVRNYFIHDSTGPEDESLRQDIEQTIPSILVDGKIKLNDEFIKMCFANIGSIVTSIETAYWTKWDLLK